MQSTFQWRDIKPHLQGRPTDLCEAYFKEMTPDVWRRLFTWLNGKIVYLECQHGRLDPHELDIEAYLNGTMSYIATIQDENNFNLSLLIIEEDELLIDIELEDINTEQTFQYFYLGIEKIAKVVNVERYFICQEFKEGTPFIENGKFVGSAQS